MKKLASLGTILIISLFLAGCSIPDNLGGRVSEILVIDSAGTYAKIADTGLAFRIYGTSKYLGLMGKNQVRFYDNDSSNYVSLGATTTIASNVNFYLPTADGTSGQRLVTDGAGHLSFSSAGGISLTDLSSSATGLTYTNTTGVFSWTSGYEGIKSASSTNYNTAYNWGDWHNINLSSSTNSYQGFLTASGTAWNAFINADVVVSSSSVKTVFDSTTASTTPDDTDKFAYSGGSILNYLTWANIKTALTTLFDLVYQPLNATLTTVAGGTYAGDDSIVTVGTITAGTWGVADYSIPLTASSTAWNAFINSDNYLLNTGDIGTGVYDFGGATSFEMPNGTNPTVDTLGEFALDTTAGQFLYYDGTVANALSSTTPKIIVVASSTMRSLEDVPTFCPAQDMTITRITCIVKGGSAGATVPINLSDGTNDTDTLTCLTTLTYDDGAIANASFTVGECVQPEYGANASSSDWITINYQYKIDRK